MPAVIDAIRACEYLFLGAVSEPEENQLRVVLLEATTGAKPSEKEVAERFAEFPEPERTRLTELLVRSNVIDHFEGCQKFELLWDNYIGYSVVNESYSYGEPMSSRGDMRLLIEFEKSNYLDYLSRATFATADYPDPFKHWEIICLNHTVDVASHVEPRVRILP